MVSVRDVIEISVAIFATNILLIGRMLSMKAFAFGALTAVLLAPLPAAANNFYVFNVINCSDKSAKVSVDGVKDSTSTLSKMGPAGSVKVHTIRLQKHKKFKKPTIKVKDWSGGTKKKKLTRGGDNTLLLLKANKKYATARGTYKEMQAMCEKSQ